MNVNEILQMVDHTLLKQEATWEQIKNICDEGMMYNTASVCIPPSYVRQAVEYIIRSNSMLKVCTVIGFPNGYNTTQVKCFETADAIENGADEIDMVINIGWVKDKRYEDILEEIIQVKEACKGKTLKVIIETCLLTEEEKVELCKIVSVAGAEYIKTSTGFSKSGATFEDVKLMDDNVASTVKIKAAGGISSLEDAEEFIKLGASRLGTSRIVKIAQELENKE